MTQNEKRVLHIIYCDWMLMTDKLLCEATDQPIIDHLSQSMHSATTAFHSATRIYSSEIKKLNGRLVNKLDYSRLPDYLERQLNPNY